MRYRSLRVACLGQWSAQLQPGFFVPGPTQVPRATLRSAVTRLSRSVAPGSTRLHLPTVGWCRSATSCLLGPPTPQPQRVAAWHDCGLGCARFARRYYGRRSLFLRLLRCFSWPGSRSPTGAPPNGGGLPHSETSGSQPARGSPEHIGAVPRPSSARSALASIVCSSCLPSVVTNAVRRRTGSGGHKPSATIRYRRFHRVSCQGTTNAPTLNDEQPEATPI